MAGSRAAVHRHRHRAALLLLAQLGKIEYLIIDVVISLFLALAVEPVVIPLVKHGWKRSFASIFALLMLGVLLCVMFGLFGNLFVQQVIALCNGLPALYQQICDFVAQYTDFKLPEINSLGGEILKIYTEDPEVIRCGVEILPLPQCLISSAVSWIFSREPPRNGTFRRAHDSFHYRYGGYRIVWIFWIFPQHRSLYTLFISYPASWFITIVLQVVCFVFVRRTVHGQLKGTGKRRDGKKEEKCYNMFLKRVRARESETLPWLIFSFRSL